MPRNRRHIPRDERANDLLDAAARLFTAGGYAATTMAEISNAAGVTRANVYWYFDSKDEIFGAVMHRLLASKIEEMARTRAGAGAYERLTAALEELYPYRSLHVEMHERLKHSKSVRAAHDTFMSWMRDLVHEVVEQAGVDTDEDLVADVIVATFEGAHSSAETRPAKELIAFILESMLGLDRPAAVPGVIRHRPPGT